MQIQGMVKTCYNPNLEISQKQTGEKLDSNTTMLLQNIEKQISLLENTLKQLTKPEKTEKTPVTDPIDSTITDSAIERINKWMGQVTAEEIGLSPQDMSALKMAYPSLVQKYSHSEQGSFGPVAYIGHYPATQVIEELLTSTLQQAKSLHPGEEIDVLKLGQNLCNKLINPPAGMSTEQIMTQVAKDYPA